MAEYTDRFYRDLESTALPSARRVWPILCDLFAPDSALDVGCGDGSWLHAAGELGIADVFGIDGPWIDRAHVKLPPDRFAVRPLDRPIDLGRRFAVALSLEVAEHLPETRAAGFVADLVRHAPVVVFAAAIPGQGGVGHVNERWPDYWAALFAGHGYRPVDVVRPRVWEVPDVTWWYAQNLILYAAPEALAAHPRLAAAAEETDKPKSLVHPDLWAARVRQAEPGFGRWLKMAPQVLRRSLAKRRARKGDDGSGQKGAGHRDVGQEERG